MSDAELRTVAVMRGRDELAAVRLGALGVADCRTVAEREIVANLGGAGVGDGQRRMRRGVACGTSPIEVAAAVGAAIDDQPLAPDAHLERQGAGMSAAVEPGRRRRAGIDDDDRLAA